MSTPASSHDLLARAFRSFERAATALEERHAALEIKAGHLERQLAGAHRRLEAVLDATAGGVAVLDARGVLVRTNRAFDEMGLGEAGRRLDEPVIECLARAGPSHGGTARLRRKTGRGVRDLAATLVPVADGEGTRVLTVQDVTEIRREEEEGGRRHRLEALGRMAAELAHEVRNPLGSIRLFASLLRDDLAGQDHLKEMADHVLASAAALEATVSNLLAFAAPPRCGFRPTDIAAVAADVCSLFAPSCGLRGVRLAGPGGDERCVAPVDPEGLRQILLNLLGNSLAATAPGGTIRVSALHEGDRAVLTVEDTGRGISPEDLPRVFDPFFTRTEGGTGLGLSIVHGIVERHGGRVTLESSPGVGTRVRVEIPAVSPHARRAKVAGGGRRPRAEPAHARRKAMRSPEACHA